MVEKLLADGWLVRSTGSSTHVVLNGRSVLVIGAWGFNQRECVTVPLGVMREAMLALEGLE